MMKEIQAGKPVSEFLNDINNNFTEIQTIKQDKIFVTANGKQVGNITFIDGVPTGGQNGDILIVYEE